MGNVGQQLQTVMGGRQIVGNLYCSCVRGKDSWGGRRMLGTVLQRFEGMSAVSLSNKHETMLAAVSGARNSSDPSPERTELMSGKRARDRRGSADSTKKSLSGSSDETESLSNSGGQRNQNRGRSAREERRRRYHSPTSTESDDSSGTSIETQRDDKDIRRGHRYRRRCVAAGPGPSGRVFTHGEEVKIIRSLRHKLLSNNGERLSRIERRLLQADRARSGVVSISTFKAALSRETKSEHGAHIGHDETIWLMEKLRGRNGKSVTISKMRGLLEREEVVVERRPGIKTSRKMKRDRDHHTRRGSTRNNIGSRGLRRPVHGSSTDDEACSRPGSGGSTTSESDASYTSPNSTQRRSSDPAPARWAIRHGTVGQWLHDVAAPIERKLFFEFIKGLERFELRNGLDHYRVRPRERRRGRHGFGSGDGGATCHCVEDDGATTLHLGPMLKASIRFHV